MLKSRKIWKVGVGKFVKVGVGYFTSDCATLVFTGKRKILRDGKPLKAFGNK